MSVLGSAIGGRRRRGRAAFVPFLTAGDPSPAWTARCVAALEQAGADVIELGVPFSDPIADGPVIQRASQRALAAGVTLSRTLALVARLRRDGVHIPIVLFTYFNPLLRMGLARFAGAARKAGVQGVLVVDLPLEEAAEFRSTLGASGLETVFLASPTTDPARLARIGAASTGFVYYVSRLGVTGARASVSGTLSLEVARVRKAARKPVAVGFGVSTPAQARAVGRVGDAVVVGSALVGLIEGRAPEAALRAVVNLAASMMKAMREAQER